MTKKRKNDYIDNKVFYEAMKEWKTLVVEMEESGQGKPPVTDYIGQCFLDIATHLSYRPNFINYPYRDEMISDGIENCIMYASNFDPEKSKNPFSYFTQIIYYAFLRRIQKEKKQSYVKYKVTLENDVSGEFSKWFKDYFESDRDPYKEVFNISESDIKKFEKGNKGNKGKSE